MIYFFSIITVFFSIVWVLKFLQFRSLARKPSEVEKITLRTMPFTLVFLSVILYYFWSSGVNPLHLLYVYPLVSWIGQIIFTLIVAPRNRKEYDRSLKKLICIVQNKSPEEELPKILSDFEYVISEELPQNLQSYTNESSREFVIENEKDFVNVGIQEMLKADLNRFFPKNTHLITYKGEFRNSPLYATIYYCGNSLIAMGATFLVDTKSFNTKFAFGINILALRSTIEREFVSKVFGKPNEIDSQLWWEKEQFSASLGFSPGSITLFIYNNLKVDIISG